MNKITIGVSSVAVLLFAIVVAGVVYAQSTTRSGDSVVGRIDYVAIEAGVDSAVCVDIAEYVDIPGMSTTFTQGGLLPNEIIVSFTGEFLQTNNPGPRVRLLIDGVPQPGSMRLNPNFDALGSGYAATVNFITNAVAPGSHIASLQWGDVGSGCLYNRSMIIHHR